MDPGRLTQKPREALHDAQTQALRYGVSLNRRRAITRTGDVGLSRDGRVWVMGDRTSLPHDAEQQLMKALHGDDPKAPAWQQDTATAA